MTNRTIGSQANLLADSSAVAIKELNCSLSKIQSEINVETNNDGQDSIIDIDVSQLNLEGLLEVHFRMKTEVHGELGEYIIYYLSEGNAKWDQFERVLFRPDGKWHDYRIPIASSGRLNTLRFTFGKQHHKLSISDLQLVTTNRALTPELLNQKQSLPGSVQIKKEQLSLSLNTAESVFKISEGKTNREWTSEPISPWLTLIDTSQENESILNLEFYDYFVQEPVYAKVALESDDVVKFSISSKRPESLLAGATRFPPRFSSNVQNGNFVFCDRSCGVLLDQQDPTYASWPLRVYGNTNCLDMPWIGLFDSQHNDGMMMLIETPADAEAAFVRHDDGKHWPEVRWLPSLDQFGYERVASYRFTSSGGYVALANEYRDYLKKQNRFKTLAEKAAEKPAVERLRGAPAFWGGRYPTKFVRQMRPLGIDRGIINNCRSPGIVSWLNGLGYLTGRYDSYTDFLEGRTAFQSDNVEVAAIHSRPGSGPKHGWKLRSGKQMYWRSSALWKQAEESYTIEELQRIPFSSRFVDVAGAAELLEDFHPNHTFDRRQDLVNRRQLFERMNSYNLVLGTEHGNDWVADLVEYFEGTMSGPFWWSSWPAGYLDRPTREQLSEKYLKYGMGYEHRVPLWELVYHDCALTTWYWGDTAGLLYESAPELSDRKDLFNILYGTTPLFWMNNTGYRLPDEIHRMLRTFHDTCQLHKHVAFDQMLNHEFLSEDRALQRTQFCNGTTVVVNFSEEPREYQDGNEKITLAPRGYLAKGSDYLQQRLWINDSPQTILAKPGFLLVESDGAKFVSNVKCKGRLTALKSDETHWNIFVSPDTAFEIDAKQITGWDLSENIRICYMDDVGEVYKEIQEADEQGILRFESKANAWRFVLVRDASEKGLAINVND